MTPRGEFHLENVRGRLCEEELLQSFVITAQTIIGHREGRLQAGSRRRGRVELKKGSFLVFMGVFGPARRKASIGPGGRGRIPWGEIGVAIILRAPLLRDCRRGRRSERMDPKTRLRPPTPLKRVSLSLAVDPLRPRKPSLVRAATLTERDCQTTTVSLSLSLSLSPCSPPT